MSIAFHLEGRFRAWVASEPTLPVDDPATLAFCRKKLAELATPGLLAEKLAHELPCTWEPLGTLLLVISEHDVLGSVAAVVAARATGNRMRVKARTTKPLLADLVRALELGDTCELADWDSGRQDDTAILDGIDGVLVAGGEATVRHYRAVTPPGVRLIELGPKVGVAAIAGPVDDALVDALVHDVTLFAQGVCSSPQLVFVDDLAVAREVIACLRTRALPALPEPDRLLQHVRAQELALLARLGEPIEVAVDLASGWGFTISRDVAHRLPKGFAFVTGSLEAFARANRRVLQTLGTWGPVPDVAGFSHRCPIGRMHERSPLAPHDGFLELAALVRFTSREP